jgi:hypothetical protein
LRGAFKEIPPWDPCLVEYVGKSRIVGEQGAEAIVALMPRPL